MTQFLEMAVDAVRRLAPEKQDQAARAIIDIVNGAEEDVYILSSEEKAALDISLAQADRGEFATDEEVAEIFAKYSR